jgi:hypothetical protein
MVDALHLCSVKYKYTWIYICTYMYICMYIYKSTHMYSTYIIYTTYIYIYLSASVETDDTGYEW